MYSHLKSKDTYTSDFPQEIDEFEPIQLPTNNIWQIRNLLTYTSNLLSKYLLVSNLDELLIVHEEIYNLR